jgi:hypothetical protein
MRAMTIYVHFKPAAKRDSIRLHNVESVRDAGPGSVIVRMTFSDVCQTFHGVARVVSEPETEE